MLILQVILDDILRHQTHQNHNFNNTTALITEAPFLNSAVTRGRAQSLLILTGDHSINFPSQLMASFQFHT